MHELLFFWPKSVAVRSKMSLRQKVPLLCFTFLISLSLVWTQDLPRMNPAALYTFSLPESYVLSELPLSALLKVKKSVNSIICTGYLSNRVSASCPAVKKNQTDIDHTEDPLPASSRSLSDFTHLFAGSDHQIPVSNELQDHRKTYYDHGNSGGGMWKGSEESGKIQKLFQFSITALAFLAFGGYLLCMIVQAIKSKGAVYYHPYATSAYGTTAQKKKKPIFSYGKRRRRRRSSSPPTDGYTPSNQSDMDLDMMYNGLISAMGVYAKLYAPV